MSEATPTSGKFSIPAKLPVLVGGALVALAVPLVASAFWLQTGLFAMAAAVGAIGLTLLIGVAGQLSLGHAFFVAVGAYGYSFLAGEGGGLGVGGGSGLGWPPLLAMVGGTAIAGLAGTIFSPIAGRLRGIYLGIATLGLVFIGQHLLKNVKPLEPVSGGFNGRAVPEFEVLGFRFDSLQRLWYLGLVLLVVAYWYAGNLKRNRPGRALEAVRDSEIVAGVMGVRVAMAKAQVFTASSVYAGLAGAILALTFRHIVPEAFGFVYSLDFLAMVVIGGLGSVGGAVLGAAFVTALPLALNQYADVIPLVAPVGSGGFDAATAARVVYGAAVVLALMFLPDGLAGLRRRRRGEDNGTKHTRSAREEIAKAG
ncbi:MAG TPA: branched-chain amino acid ABC transporter permease [Acidimicrobiia bacterium]|nr:branched-chain amino acid ABC transporter permease [Acidimicrobiia bacterium]